ncbi:hypothetical protein [Streptomyces sp. MMS24-I29]|uniref:hypothetical protein n=1 Tax=Streptomyces sp. MMS24-I29 TaxID=3351480 RepID=UPI003C7A6D5D
MTTETLEHFEIPTPEEYRTYWAATPHNRGQVTDALALPRMSRSGVTPAGAVHIWVDPEEGWLWVSVPVHRYAWTTPEQRASNPPAGDEVIPAWIQAAETNWQCDGVPSLTGLLVRRRISAAEADGLLSEIMPGTAKYPLPGELASILRKGGWAPADLTSLWWRLETERDAAALAARLPSRWRRDRWPLTTHEFPGAVAERLTPLRAREISVLTAAGVPADLLRECIVQGITDVSFITSVRIPRIHDDATRIGFLGGFHVDAATARRKLESSPGYWLAEVTADNGPVPLHVASAWDGDPGHFVVWSDGQLDSGHVNPPESVPRGEETRTWHRRYRAFEATQDLLSRVLSAANREVLTPELWMPWRNATHTDREETVRHLTERALAADTTAAHVLTLTRFTVHQADGARAEVWETRARLMHREQPGETFWSDERWICTTEIDARDQMEALDDGLPPVVTVWEAAVILGTTRTALAQAIARGKHQRRADAATPPAQRVRRTHLPYPAITTGRTGWYNPRALARWWRDRPGRGRTA